MSFQLLAVDRGGVVALFTNGADWFRVSMDNGWKPTPLRDEIDAHRFLFSGQFEPALTEFISLDGMIIHLRNFCLRNIQIPQIIFADVADQCPAEFRSRAPSERQFQPIKTTPRWVFPEPKEMWVRLREAVRRFQQQLVVASQEPHLAGLVERRQAEVEMWTLLAAQVRYVCRYFRQPPILDPEEVASEALARIIDWVARRSPSTLLDPDLPDHLFRILWSTCRYARIDSFRAYYSARRYPPGGLVSLTDVLEEATAVPSPDPSPSEDLARAEELAPVVEAVATAMGELSESERAVVRLRFWSGLSYSEIAEILHITAPTARSKATRALQKLRDILNKHPLLKD